MRIWIFNHYAGTPFTTQATTPYDISKELVKRGHEVTIFASSLGEYKFLDLIEKGTVSVKEYDGIKFVWIKTQHYTKNNWRRVLNMASYGLRALFVALRMKERPDCVIGTNPHLLAVLSGYLVSVIKRSCFFFEIKDLWPQTLIDMGMLPKKGVVTYILKKIERFLLKKSDRILAAMPHVDIYLAGLGMSAEKVVWMPNGIDLSRYKNITDYSGGKSDDFTLMYLGRHGAANALEIILTAAKILQDQNEHRVKFVLAGDGPEKKNLIALAKKFDLNNVQFLDAVSKDNIWKIINKADAFIFSLKNLPLFEYGISPNKLLDYMVSRRPVLFLCNSKNNPIETVGAGITVPPEDPKSLVVAVKKLISLEPSKRVQMGKMGFEYVENNHNIKILADRFETTISEICNKSRRK